MFRGSKTTRRHCDDVRRDTVEIIDGDHVVYLWVWMFCLPPLALLVLLLTLYFITRASHIFVVGDGPSFRIYQTT